VAFNMPNDDVYNAACVCAYLEDQLSTYKDMHTDMYIYRNIYIYR